MLEITNAEASANILRFVAEKRLTQGAWHSRGGDGREIACLLGSIHPNVTSAAECNGALMPMWLAQLTPTLFDGIPAEAVYPFARRYGEFVARWHLLDDAAWRRVLNKLLIKCIDDAVDAARPVSHGKDYWVAVEAACTQSKAAIESGDKEAAWAAAEAAGAARAARAPWAARAAWVATEAAWAAARAPWAAGAAVGAVVGAAVGAAAGASLASLAAAYLRLANFVLDQIEAELS